MTPASTLPRGQEPRPLAPEWACVTLGAGAGVAIGVVIEMLSGAGPIDLGSGFAMIVALIVIVPAIATLATPRPNGASIARVSLALGFAVSVIAGLAAMAGVVSSDRTWVPLFRSYVPILTLAVALVGGVFVPVAPCLVHAVQQGNEDPLPVLAVAFTNWIAGLVAFGAFAAVAGQALLTPPIAGGWIFGALTLALVNCGARDAGRRRAPSDGGTARRRPEPPPYLVWDPTAPRVFNFEPKAALRATPAIVTKSTRRAIGWTAFIVVVGGMLAASALTSAQKDPGTADVSQFFLWTAQPTSNAAGLFAALQIAVSVARSGRPMPGQRFAPALRGGFAVAVAALWTVKVLAETQGSLSRLEQWGVVSCWIIWASGLAVGCEIAARCIRHSPLALGTLAWEAGLACRGDALALGLVSRLGSYALVAAALRALRLDRDRLAQVGVTPCGPADLIVIPVALLAILSYVLRASDDASRTVLVGRLWEWGPLAVSVPTVAVLVLLSRIVRRVAAGRVGGSVPVHGTSE